MEDVNIFNPESPIHEDIMKSIIIYMLTNNSENLTGEALNSCAV